MKITLIFVLAIVLLLYFPNALEATIGIFQKIEYSSNESIKKYGKVNYLKVKNMRKHIYKINGRVTLFRPVSPDKVIAFLSSLKIFVV